MNVSVRACECVHSCVRACVCARARAHVCMCVWPGIKWVSEILTRKERGRDGDSEKGDILTWM